MRADSSVSARLAPRLGLFDATMVVMGGIVGSGIFINPYVVAREVHSVPLILGAWILGGIIALAGAFVYAELAARLPVVGGQYAYLREAYHPAVAFLYGWVLLLVIQTGGMAAVAVTFAHYFLELTHARVPGGFVAAAALAVLAIVNCLGVRPGSTVQSALMVLKTLVILILVTAGVSHAFHSNSPAPQSPPCAAPDTFLNFGAALVPVLFAYGGWQTASFLSGEMRHPKRDLPRGLLFGVSGVILLYLSVNWVCVHTLGPAVLAASTTPASAAMRVVWGQVGAVVIALGVVLSTLGFLAQSILTAPRVYFAMAKDGLFFRAVARLHPRTHAPWVAILLQSAWAIVISLSGRYDQILSYVVSMDFLFFGLTAATLFVFRRRAARRASSRADGDSLFRVPGHPFTTIFFIAASWLVVFNAIYRYPHNTVIGFGILLAGVPVCYLWSRRNRRKGLA
jgi:basic amino acid/polyamine antiporter, APA family